ncbi:MAG: DUF2975 domain-containing protein [Anaerolineales bacterium]|jgi:hypothetical protein
MSAPKNLKLARSLKIFLDILFVLALIVFIGLLIWTAVSPLVLRRPDTFGTVTLPVRIGEGDDPQFDVSFNSAPALRINDSYVEEAHGTFVFTTTSAQPVIIANFAKLLSLAGLAYVFYLLRSVMITIKDGEPFTAKNVVHIRRIGYLVLALGVLSPVVQFTSSILIMNTLPNTAPVLQPGPAFDGKVILLALFILLIAQIWSHGIELEHEHALTI